MARSLAYLSIAILLAAGWNQPFSEHYSRIVGQNRSAWRAPAAVPVSYTQPSSVRDNDWMWKKGTLDAPAPKK